MTTAILPDALSEQEVAEALANLTPEERAEFNALLDADLAAVRWSPMPGPQALAWESEADVIGFGGAAGGGKTDLALGMALQQHYRTLFLRKEATQLVGATDRLVEILGGDRTQVVGKPPVYRNRGATNIIEFGSMPNPGDETKHQGRPKDLIVLDEATNFPEYQVRFVKGWNRTTKKGQRRRTLMTFNPPTDAEGRWVVSYFAPWLDKKHALYATTKPGQLRWVYVDPLTGSDVWLQDDDNRVFVLEAGERIYDFDPLSYTPEQIVEPESRTFIPSRVTDNPHLVTTGYIKTLQALPEPLRSQMLYGDFDAGVQDDPYQVIPTAWIEAAMARWKEPARRGEMMSMGVDVARGGQDNTITAKRHKGPDGTPWYDRLHVAPGRQTPDGHTVAGLVIAERRDAAPIHIDVIGVGASPYDILVKAKQDVYGVNVAQVATEQDISGQLDFYNLRSQLWWQMREDLDPANERGVALPPDPDLLAELAAPRWELSGRTIKVESRDAIIERVGRSPDRATAVILARIDTPKLQTLARGGSSTSMRNSRQSAMGYDPMADLKT